jgi:hypothetical protein
MVERTRDVQEQDERRAGLVDMAVVAVEDHDLGRRVVNRHPHKVRSECGKLRLRLAPPNRCARARQGIGCTPNLPRSKAMTIHPKNQKDLMLAPVAAEIDRNLQRLRDGSPEDVIAELELELDRPAKYVERDERAELVLRQALRNVDLHGWTAAITDDGARVHLYGGSVSLDLGLSTAITSYIQNSLHN